MYRCNSARTGSGWAAATGLAAGTAACGGAVAPEGVAALQADKLILRGELLQGKGTQGFQQEQPRQGGAHRWYIRRALYEIGRD